MFEQGTKVFFSGIGGIGVSGLAGLLYERGVNVSGADLAESESTNMLREIGVKITIGHAEANLPDDASLLVYSSAVPSENPERRKAARLNLTQMSYPEALGELTKAYRLVAVAGTNGKTTTSAMVATILETAGLDPTAVVGSKVIAWGKNYRVGRSRYFVLEADEYRRAFLNYHPEIAVVTNIAADHLDYYRNLADIQSAFRGFAASRCPQGILVFNADDGNSRGLAQSPGKKLTFGFSKKADLNWSSFGRVNLSVPGRIYQEDAAAAAAASTALGVSKSNIVAGLRAFRGTLRRFEKVGSFSGAAIISDYAHHPDEIRGTLEIAEGLYDPARVLVVFQPHQHNRTKTLFKEFTKAFCENRIKDFLFPEIFDVAGREERPDQDISSRDLAESVEKCGKNASYAIDLSDAEVQVRAIAEQYEAILFLGAGDIYRLADRLVK